LGGDRRLYGEAADDWAVVSVDHAEPLSPAALGRTLKVVCVDALEEVVDLVAQQRHFLQTAGVAATPQALFGISALLG
ncbi:acyl-CoA reductase, partial [Klebsiella pneumoniae]|nr:acyl-CoA reductase [Klebsiella pneumoniae]